MKHENRLCVGKYKVPTVNPEKKLEYIFPEAKENGNK